MNTKPRRLGRAAIAVVLGVALVGGLAAGAHAWTHSGSAPALIGPLSGAARGEPPFEARVIQRVPAGSYTYLYVERPNAVREWVVTLTSSAGARAARVRVTPMGYAERFASKRLDRVFDRLHFAVVRPL